MKYLVLTDLHGKRSAMDWINPLIKNEGIDCVLFLGDAVELPTAPEESIKMIGMIECKRILAIPGNIDSPDMIGMIDQATTTPKRFRRITPARTSCTLSLCALRTL